MLLGMVRRFSSPLVFCLVLALCLWVSDLSVMLLPSPVGWAEHNHPSVGRVWRARARNACRHGTVATGTLALHLFSAVVRKTTSAGHTPSAGPDVAIPRANTRLWAQGWVLQDFLPCAISLWQPVHWGTESRTKSRKGIEETEMWGIRKAINHSLR